MSIETFDDFDSTEQMQDYSNNKPYALRDDKSDEGTLEWLNSNFDQMEQKAQSRMISYQRWNYLYKGIHWRNVDHRDSRYGGRDAQYAERKPRMVDNFIKEFIDARAAQMARLGSNFTAIPWNNEIEDENVAKACEKLLKGRADEIELEEIHNEADTVKYKYGTSFLMVKWDKDEGPDSPMYKRLEEIYPEGIPSKIQSRIRDMHIKSGDVKVYVQTPDRIFPEINREDWTTKGKSPIRHIDEVEWVNIHELQEEYPNVEIKENQRNYYDYSTNEISKPVDQVMVRHFYHPPSKHHITGEYIKYIDSGILERVKYPFKHKMMPFEVDRDMVLDNELWGRPTISQIEQMNRHYNNISSSQARDLGVGSAPKWMVSKGSADFRTINNEFTIVEYKGGIAPVLVKGNPISGDGIVIQDRMEKRMSKHMKVFDISRGDIPQGITANSALRFLDEQESQTLAPDEKKRKRRVRNVYKLMAALMGQYYEANDGRVLRTLGKNNKYMIEDMKAADFTKVYDVQLQNTSALPDTKTGKIAAIIDLNMATQTDPVFRREDVVNMLDMGTDETFTEETTFSLDCAKQMLTSMLAGKQIPEPQMHDDLLVFYTTMYRHIQSFQFKTTVPEQVQTTVYEYIKTLEGLIWIKAQTNMKLAAEVQMLAYFPSFFEMPAPAAPTTEGEEGVKADAELEKEGMKLDEMEHANQNIEAARDKSAQQ